MSHVIIGSSADSTSQSLASNSKVIQQLIFKKAKTDLADVSKSTTKIEKSQKDCTIISQEFNLPKRLLSTSNEPKLLSSDSINYCPKPNNILLSSEKAHKITAESSSSWFLQRLTGEKTLTRSKNKRGLFWFILVNFCLKYFFFDL